MMQEDQLQGLMGPSEGMDSGGMDQPTWDDMPQDEVDTAAQQIQSQFLDFSSDVLEKEEKEVLVQVFEDNPFIVDIVDKVFGALTGQEEESMEGDPSELVSPGDVPTDQLRGMLEGAETSYDQTMAPQQEQGMPGLGMMM